MRLTIRAELRHLKMAVQVAKDVIEAGHAYCVVVPRDKSIPVFSVRRTRTGNYSIVAEERN